MGCVLLNRTQSDFVQTTNWLYYSDDNWSSDPKLTISTSLPSVSPMIKISLMEQQPEYSPGLGGSTDPMESGAVDTQSSVMVTCISVFGVGLGVLAPIQTKTRQHISYRVSQRQQQIFVQVSFFLNCSILCTSLG